MCHFCLRGRRDLHLEDLAPVTPNARQPGGNSQPEEQQMTGAEILTYLRAVAEYLRRKHQKITLVGVGGIVSTVALGTRNTTHDVDIMCDSVSSEQTRHLTDTIRKVAQKNSLDDAWLNNQTILHIPAHLRGIIQQDAIRQNYVILDHEGLKVVAASWMYSFASKLHRISGSGASALRVYDPSDAASFLLKYLEGLRRPSVTRLEVKNWLAHYQIGISDVALARAGKEVNTTARRQIIV